MSADASKMLALARLAINAGTTEHERAAAAAQLARLVARDGAPGASAPPPYDPFGALGKIAEMSRERDQWRRIAEMGAAEVLGHRAKMEALKKQLDVALAKPKRVRPKPRKGKPAARCVLCNLPRWCETCNQPPVKAPTAPIGAAPFVAGLTCSFCGKSHREVRKLVAGPTVYICNECVDLSHEIVHSPEWAVPA